MAEKLNLETLESWLWDSANIMRGHIDSSDFKNYIFGLLFLKRASDQFFEEAQIAADEEGITLEEAIEDEDFHRFYVPEVAWWGNITKKTENIGQAIDQVRMTLKRATKHGAHPATPLRDIFCNTILA